MALLPRQRPPEYRDLDGMTGQELLAAYREPSYQHRTHSMVCLRRDRHSLYDHHWETEGGPRQENPRPSPQVEVPASERLRAMSMAAEVYLAGDWKHRQLEQEAREARDFQLDQRRSSDPWVRDFPIRKARLSPEVIRFIEREGDGWYGEINRRGTLAGDIRQAGAHLIYRGMVQGDSGLAERGRHMVQEGLALIADCLTGDTGHPLLRYVPLHHPGVQAGPDHFAVARERLDYISTLADHYGNNPASASLLASFMRDTITARDSDIYLQRARVTCDTGREFPDGTDVACATYGLFNLREGRLTSYLGRALQEDRPEAVARVYIAMQTALDTLINHDAPAICGQRYGSALEFERWLGEGEYGVRRGLQDKLELVLTLDSFGERPLDPMIREGLEQDRWITADGYAITMLLVAIREYPERGRLTPSLFLLSGE